MANQYGLSLVQHMSCIQMPATVMWFESGATRVVYSDASDCGYGGYFVEIGPEFAHGNWSKDEAVLSLTRRELKAVYRVLCSLASKLKGHCQMVFRQSECYSHCASW
jgi:hypothetical protein